MDRAKKETGCNCDYCVHYDWDEEGEYYECNMNLDEDEMARFLTQNTSQCHYFRLYDEYKIVQKQN